MYLSIISIASTTTALTDHRLHLLSLLLSPPPPCSKPLESIFRVMVLPCLSTVAGLRGMRAAVATSKKMAPHRPSPANTLTSARLCSIGSFSTEKRRSNSLPPATSSSSVSTLNFSLAQLKLAIQTSSCNFQQQKQHQERSLSSLSQSKQPLGEPITFITLNNLRDNPGAVKKARRIGRGIGSSKGKTCGRGHKGQKSRAGGGVHPTFEGGQTKFYKRMPKIGKMKNANFKLELIPLNVGKVQDYVTMGRLRPERSDGVLTMRDFVNAGMFPTSSVKTGVKLLGDGKEFVKDKLLIEVPFASASAIEAIESRGGFVTTVHYNRLALRALLKPHKFPNKPEVMLAREYGDGVDASELDLHDTYLLPRRARPPPKYMPYYNDFSKRGYLNPKVQLERKKRGLKDL